MVAQFPHAAFALASGVHAAPDGLDSAFGTGGRVRTSFGDLTGGANDAVLQPDGKIVAVGFQAYYPTTKGVQFALARYLAR